MALPVDELTKPLTVKQAKATLYTLLAKAGVSTTSWASGAVLRTLVWIVAVVLAAFTAVLAVIVKGLFLDSATGRWLTLLALYVYGVTRRGVTFATGEITFNNAKGGEYPFAVNECLVLCPSTGKTYWNTEAFTIAPLQTGLKVQFEAREGGSASTATSNTITELVSPLIGVTVTNAEAFVGTDEESDEELRRDCRAALGALSPFGASDAYRFFAKYVPGAVPGDPFKALLDADGNAIGINRVNVITPNFTGLVKVIVATPSGDVPGDVLTEGTPLYIVDRNLKKYATPATVTEQTFNADEVNFIVIYSVLADAASGLTSTQVKAKIAAALTAYFAEFPIGGVTSNGTDYYAFLSSVIGVIWKADPSIFDVKLTSPLTDQALEPDERVKLIISNASTVTMVTQ